MRSQDRLRSLRYALGATLVAAAGVRALGRGWPWPLSRYIVEGSSMEPAYQAGDRLLVNRLAYLRRRPAPGDVVVLRDPERPGHYLLKRIAGSGDGGGEAAAGYVVLGDNAAESRDSRAFGPVARRQIVGKAWLRY